MASMCFPLEYPPPMKGILVTRMNYVKLWSIIWNTVSEGAVWGMWGMDHGYGLWA